MPRRPSTAESSSAGLLTADPLRRLGSTWMGATPGSFASKPLCDLDLSPPPRRSKPMRRIALFLLFMALLVVLPAAFMGAAP
jgi:hypothetical protein